MFNQTKYTRWYHSIVSRAKSRSKPQPAEKHHIIPKSMGGGKGDNIVHLTPREHFVCHRLLPKMMLGWKQQRQMLWALHRMLFSNSPGQQRYRATSRTYEHFRKEFYEVVRGKPRIITEKHSRNIAKANRKRTKGKTLEEQHGVKKAAQIKIKHSQSRTGERNGMFDKHHTVQSRQKIGDTRRGNNYGRIGEKASMFGKCWVTNGSKPIVITKDQLRSYLINGYSRGRTI